jgi:hypothetical protein
LTNVTLAGVETLFRQQQARGAFPGGQLVVQHGDQRLLDVAVGTASGWRRAGADPTLAARFEGHPAFESAVRPVAAGDATLRELTGALDPPARRRR